MSRRHPYTHVYINQITLNFSAVIRYNKTCVVFKIKFSRRTALK